MEVELHSIEVSLALVKLRVAEETRCSSLSPADPSRTL